MLSRMFEGLAMVLGAVVGASAVMGVGALASRLRTRARKMLGVLAAASVGTAVVTGIATMSATSSVDGTRLSPDEKAAFLAEVISVHVSWACFGIALGLALGTLLEFLRRRRAR